jgi:hypothetical protein
MPSIEKTFDQEAASEIDYPSHSRERSEPYNFEWFCENAILQEATLQKQNFAFYIFCSVASCNIGFYAPYHSMPHEMY